MNIRLKGLIFLCGFVFLASCLYFYNQSANTDDGVIKIGYSADNLVIERWKRDQEVFKEKANEAGIEVIFSNANENNKTQVAQIQAMIDENVDVIVVIPYDKDGVTDVVNKAIKAGIKVISYDRLINNSKIDAYISFDNYKVGKLMAESLVDIKPEGNYVIINGSPDDNNSSMFNEGYKSVLDQYDIEIINEVWAENWREIHAYTAVSEILNKNIKIDAIIGANDRLAEAAIRALSEKSLAGQVLVAGHDADVSACQRIIEGTQHITIYKPIRSLAEGAFELSLSLAKDEKLEYSNYIDNGKYEIPYIKLDVIAVKKENMMKTIIEDGFHLKEDVYRK